MAAFTDTELRKLTPGRARIIKSKHPFLFVAVSKRAVMFKFKKDRRDPTRPKGWVTTSATIGSVHDLSVAQALARAFELAAQCDEGINPNGKAKPEGTTLGELWDMYLEDLRRRGRDPYNYKHYGKHLSDWMDRPARSLTRGDVLGRFQSITEMGLTGRPAPYSANRTRECLRAVLAYALTRGYVSENVAAVQDGGQRFARNPERKRSDEALEFDLLPIWWAAWAETADPIRRAFHATCLLTGTRLATAKRLRWDWVRDGWLTVPGSALKMSNDWRVPISVPLQHVLDRTPRNGPLIFAGLQEHREKGPLAGMTGKKLRKTYRTALDKIGAPKAHAEYLHQHVVAGIEDHYINRRELEADLLKWQTEATAFLISQLSITFRERYL
ncbi:MAG: hypothetical protein KJ622_03690 [Alphaproteobacteria bacterium]|nr:hypothetical protein [Alphaproteobacteria bacterium]